jgi:hypothetical protein
LGEVHTFLVVLFCSITPLSSTCIGRLYLLYREKNDKDRDKECSSITVRGLEPNKKAAKKNGHLTIYSLFKAIINVWLTF